MRAGGNECHPSTPSSIPLPLSGPPLAVACVPGTMFPVPVNPIEPGSAPGAVFCVAPWTGDDAIARPGDAIRLDINSRLLRDDGSALIVEPPHGAELHTAPVVFRIPGYDTLTIGQGPSLSRRGLPVVYVFVHATVVGTPASPWLHALRGYTATVLRHLPCNVIHYKATFTQALLRRLVQPAQGRPSSRGASRDGGSGGSASAAGGADDGRRRSARLAGDQPRS